MYMPILHIFLNLPERLLESREHVAVLNEKAAHRKKKQKRVIGENPAQSAHHRKHKYDRHRHS